MGIELTGVQQTIPHQEVALYYPEIEPPDEWLRYNLLMYDRVVSMQPEVFDVNHGELTATQAEASALGVWDIAVARTVLHGGDSVDQSYLEEIRSALGEIAKNRASNGSSVSSQVKPRREHLYRGKLANSVTAMIVKSGLGEENEGGFDVDPDVMLAVMSITAKFVAWASHDSEVKYVPSTESLSAAKMAIAPLRTDNESQANHSICRQFLLHGLEFTPRDDVRLEKVIAFREKYHEELQRLRQQIDILAYEALATASPTNALNAKALELDMAVGQVQRAASGMRIGLKAQSILVATTVTGGAALVSSSPSPMDFVGIWTTVAGFWITFRSLSILKSPESPYSYVVAARSKFG